VDFEALVEHHKDAVYRQMVRACGNHADAEDVLIDALLNAYRAMGQLERPEAFRAWLAQIGRRVCWQLKRREALRPVLQLSQLEDEGLQVRADEPPPDVALALADMRRHLLAAIDALPAGDRDVYRLRELEGYSGQDVADELGISLAAQKSRLHRARSRVRRYLDRALAAR